MSSEQLPLGRELLAEKGKLRVNVKSVHRKSPQEVVITFTHEHKQYQDLFIGDKKECDTMELEAAGKDIWATLAPDIDDNSSAPKIESVEIVGND